MRKLWEWRSYRWDINSWVELLSPSPISAVDYITTKTRDQSYTSFTDENWFQDRFLLSTVVGKEHLGGTEEERANTTPKPNSPKPLVLPKILPPVLSHVPIPFSCDALPAKSPELSIGPGKRLGSPTLYRSQLSKPTYFFHCLNHRLSIRYLQKTRRRTRINGKEGQVWAWVKQREEAGRGVTQHRYRTRSPYSGGPGRNLSGSKLHGWASLPARPPLLPHPRPQSRPRWKSK